MCLMLLSSTEKKKVKSGTITDKYSTTEKSCHAELSNQRKPKQYCTGKKEYNGRVFREMYLSTHEKQSRIPLLSNREIDRKS